MARPSRRILALAVLLVALLGTVRVARAEEIVPTATPSSSTEAPYYTFSTTEEINDFLVSNYDQLTPEERDLIQKIIQTREANAGEGNFFSLPAVKQVEVVGEVVNGLSSALWPTRNEDTQAWSPGVLGQLALMTDTIIDSPQPVTANEMIASLNPTSRVLAQAIGVKAFQDLPQGRALLLGFSPSGVILTYWKACRNLAYALLTAVLVVFGFMIMMRKSIEPRVTMTISNALPRIAAALVMITFSFAISGLIIDVGRVTDGVLKSFDPGTQATDHSIFTLLYEFSNVGLTNMKATMKTTTYVWKFPEDTLDRSFPEWRCDYPKRCSGGSCQYRVGYVDQDNPGSWKACEPFYCSLGPFGIGGKRYNCSIVINAKPVKVNFWFGGKQLTIIPALAFPLIDPDDVPGGDCRVRATGVSDPDLYPNGQWVLPNNDLTYRSKACCNEDMNECHDAEEIPWVAPWPRNFGNVIELWLNKIILIIIGALINFLFFITLLQTIFSLLFKLLTCFAMWFILAIFSPLVFMWGAVPGQEDTISTWAKNFLANVLAFPVVNFVINLALAIALDYKGGAIPEAFPSLIFIGNPNSVAMLVPFGIIIMTPQIPDALKDLIGAKSMGGKGSPGLGGAAKKLPLIGGLVG